MQRFFYFVGRDDRGDNENENYEKHACSKIYNILQVFIKSKKTVDALSLLTEEGEGFLLPGYYDQGPGREEQRQGQDLRETHWSKSQDDQVQISQDRGPCGH